MRRTFDEKYFSERPYYAYKLQLRQVVQELFYGIMHTVCKKAHVNILNGEGRKALDIGCAFGYVTDLLEKLRYEVVGVDISSYAIGRAHAVFPSSPLIEADALHMPLRADSFDLITCFEVLEHILAPHFLVRETEQLLKQGGVCLCTTPVRGWVRTIYDRMGREDTHVSLLELKEVSTMISKYFQTNLMFPFLVLPLPPQLFNRYFLVTGVPPFVSSGVIIVSVKTGK